MKPQEQVDDLSNLLFFALRSYRRGKLEEAAVLTQMALVAQKLQQSQTPGNEQTRHWALCRVLEDGVEALRQDEPTLAELLRLRFFQGRSVVETAQRLTISESSIFYRQKRAVHLLSHWLLTQENLASQPAPPAQPVCEPPPVAGAPLVTVTPPPAPTKPPTRRYNLPPSSYNKIFGLEKQKQALQNALKTTAGPWLITLVGMGGMGKTTLAHLVSTWAAAENLYAQVIWVTFKQEEYDTWRGQQQSLVNSPDQPQPPLTSTPALTPTGTFAFSYAQLLETIAGQLGLPNVGAPPHAGQPATATPNPNPYAAREAQLRTYLAEYPALLVIDNLESVEEYTDLVRAVRALTQPSKVLVTSRYSTETPGTLVVRMDELSWPETLALLLYEAEERGISDLAAAPPESLRPIYTVVGGNPLALKLVIGQLTLLPLDEVLQRLQQARQSKERAEYELYHYLYRSAWQMLSAPAREVLLTMVVLSPQGASWEELLEASELERTQLTQAVRECTNRSLLTVTGWPNNYYAIHRLTYTFLMTDILQWWS